MAGLAFGDPITAAVGGVFGLIGGEKAEEAAGKAIAEEYKKQLEKASEKGGEELNKLLTRIEQALKEFIQSPLL